MASKKQQQDELLSTIDAIMACIEQYPMFNLTMPLGDVNAAVNAMSLLMLLLGKFFTEEELIKWLSNFLVKSLPVLELGVKGVLLANLKNYISCNIDPWIPDEWRQHFGNDIKYKINTNAETNGMDKIYASAEEDPTMIPIPMIDYRGILQINPMTKLGQQYYYKTKLEYTHENPTNSLLTKHTASSYSELYSWVKEMEKNFPLLGFYSVDYIKQTGDITSIYELARANDMNAFLWFVANKGVYGSPINESINENNKKEAIKLSTTVKNIPLNTINNTEVNEYGVYLSGDIITTYSSLSDNKKIDSTNYLLCYDGQRTFTKDNFTYYSKIIPCSNDTNSYNWYVNRKNYMKMIFDGVNKKSIVSRNYDNEFPLCNFSCRDKSGNIATNALENSIQVKVLPQPMLHYKKEFWFINKEQKVIPSPFTKILFNEKGEVSKQGHFTVCPKKENGKVLRTDTNDENHTTYILVNPKTGEETDFVLVVSDKDYGVNLKCNIYESKNKQVSLDKFVNDCLIACYPGLTIYEFNYDFVMGMKLFDAKSVAYRIIQTLTSFRLDGDFSLSMTETLYQMRISEIIKNLINADDYEISDCFFSFSNEKYQSMLDEAEQRRANQYPFIDGEHSVEINGEEILNILDEFKSDATLNEQKDTLERTFTQAAANITNEVLPEDKLNFSKNFIMEAIKVLAITIFETLISPKMLLLFEVNKRIMGDFRTELLDIEALFKELSNLITSIISEIMKTIISELLSLVMTKISELLAKLAAMVTLEQLTFYKELIMKLIKACTFSFPLFGHRANLDTQLDVVQYADIDEVDKPQTNEC